MKASLSVLLLAIICAAPLCGEHLSAPPGGAQQSPPAKAEPHAAAKQSRAKNAPSSKVTPVKKSSVSGTAKTSRSVKTAKTLSRSKPGGAVSPVRQTTGRTVNAKSPSTAYGATSSRSSSVHTGGRLQASLHPPNPLPHRGPYAAVLGGAANSRTATTGAIAGTGMSRKH